jgi:hypothetical protein
MESFHPASLSLVAPVLFALLTLPSLATISPTSRLTGIGESVLDWKFREQRSEMNERLDDGGSKVQELAEGSSVVSRRAKGEE